MKQQNDPRVPQRQQDYHDQIIEGIQGGKWIARKKVWNGKEYVIIVCGEALIGSKKNEDK